MDGHGCGVDYHLREIDHHHRGKSPHPVVSDSTAVVNDFTPGVHDVTAGGQVSGCGVSRQEGGGGARIEAEGSEVPPLPLVSGILR